MFKTFCNWAEKEGFLEDNPILKVEKPRVAKRLMPAITEPQLQLLWDECNSVRDKAILSLLFDSGLRISELANIKGEDIDFEHCTVTVVGKGNRQRKAPFTEATAQLLRLQLANNGCGNIWGITASGITTLLRRMQARTGIRCNPHAFRRGFACRLHRKGVSTLSIQRLGGWASMRMVLDYTASITFEDCLTHYHRAIG